MYKRVFNGILLSSTALISTCAELNAKTYIVHMRSPTTFKNLFAEWQDSVRQPSRDIFGRRRLDFPTTLNSRAQTLKPLENLGMLVIEGSEEDARTLARNGDVQSVEEDFMIPRPAPVTASDLRANFRGLPQRIGQAQDGETTDELPWGLHAVKAPEAWALNAKGQNVRVMVLDTGIDRDHVDLRDRFEEGKNFVTNFPFSLSDGPEVATILRTLEGPWFQPGPDNPNAPYEYYDSEGHGTHVSGTIAGSLDNHGVAGVAPEARILMGRVCGARGCAGSAIVKGLNWALSKNVNVVSMSLGGGFNSPSQEEAIRQLDEAGIVTVAASGNSGEANVSYPAALSSVISVGAVDSSGKRAKFSQYGPELQVVAPGVDVTSSIPTGTGRSAIVKVVENGVATAVRSAGCMGTPINSEALENEVVLAGLGRTEDFATINVTGKYVLIERGEIPFSEKAANAVTAGASGIVFYNNAEGLSSGSLTDDGSLISIPAVVVEKTTGESIKAAIEAGRPQRVNLVVSATDYATFSGTSMATPHTSGVVALMLSAHPGMTPTQVRDLLKSTATPAAAGDNLQNEYGSGMINAETAVTAAKAIPTT